MSAIDVFWIAIPPEETAFSHSVVFAGLLGLLVAAATLPSAQWRGYRVRLALFVALATAAHGVLDTLTSIGAVHEGVQFFSPLTPLIWYRRGVPWPRRDERPVTLELR